MVPDDPISGGPLIRQAADAGLNVANGLLQKVLGPAAEELGKLLHAKAHLYTLRKLPSVLAQTAEILQSYSINELREVPLKTLIPIIEGAILEDDETLSQKWAGLLASAAVSIEPNAAHPSFPRILSEITPHEAAILERLVDSDSEVEWIEFRRQLTIDFSCSENLITAAIDNLFRLNLANVTHQQKTGKGVAKITTFGRTFIAATHGPKSES